MSDKPSDNSGNKIPPRNPAPIQASERRHLSENGTVPRTDSGNQGGTESKGSGEKK